MHFPDLYNLQRYSFTINRIKPATYVANKIKPATYVAQIFDCFGYQVDVRKPFQIAHEAKSS